MKKKICTALPYPLLAVIFPLGLPAFPVEEAVTEAAWLSCRSQAGRD